MLRIRKQGAVRVGTLAVLAAATAAGGCGKATQANPDGGDGVVTTPDAQAGRHSFDVVAVLHATGTTALPQTLSTSSFTLVLDADARLAIVGANGGGAVVGVTSADGRTFRSAGRFTVPRVNTDSCSSGLDDVTYDNFEVTVAGGSLIGSAGGTALIPCGDCAIPVAFTASLTGSSDVTPPALRAFRTPPTSPLDTFRLVTSEPLPASATARLVADDGAVIDLVPQIVAGDLPIVVAFSKPAVVLRAGHAYSITLDGLVDFAGHVDPGGPPLRLASFVAAPAVPEDGFESARESVLGGAMVMTAGPLPAIAGNITLYVGTKGAPALDSSTGRSLMVRLARQPGDTKLRFSYRSVGLQAQAYFVGTMTLGSEGATPGPLEWLGDVVGTAEMLTVAGQTVFVSPVGTKEAALPPDATDEVLFAILPATVSCFPGGSPNVGLLIDDLRLE